MSKIRKIELTDNDSSIRIKDQELIEILISLSFGFEIILKTFGEGSCELWKSRDNCDEKFSCGHFFSLKPLIFSREGLTERYFVENLTNGSIFIEILENKEAPVEISREDILKIRGQIVEGSLSDISLEGREYALKRFYLNPGEITDGLVLNSLGFRFDIILLRGKGKIFPDHCFELEYSVSDLVERVMPNLSLFELGKEYFIRNVYVENGPLDFIVIKSKKSE